MVEKMVRGFTDAQLRAEHARLVAQRQPGWGEYEKAIGAEFAKRGFYGLLFAEGSEFKATNADEFASQLQGMGLPVTESGVQANLYCGSAHVSVGKDVHVQWKFGDSKVSVSYYTGEGSCQWAHNLATYPDLVLAVLDFLHDRAPLTGYALRIAKATGVNDPAEVRQIEQRMRERNGGLLDDLLEFEFNTLARSQVTWVDRSQAT